MDEIEGLNNKWIMVGNNGQPVLTTISDTKSACIIKANLPSFNFKKHGYRLHNVNIIFSTKLIDYGR